MERSRLSLFGVVLLAVVTLGWGFAWPFIKIVLAEVSPLTYRSICLLGGGGGVLVIARLGGQRLAVPSAQWGRLLAISACSIVGWNLFVIYGIAGLSSGRAALLGYTMPLWSTLLSLWLLGERLSARRAIALALGIGGIGVLLAADVVKMAGAPVGVLLMIGAAMWWGLGTVLMKRFALPIPTAVLTGWMMLAGGVPIAIAAVILERDRWHPVSSSAVIGLAYSVVIAFMLCYWAWNRLVLMVPVAVSSVSVLATPVIGVLSGMWLLHEPLTWHEVAAGACIVGAIGLVVRDPRRS
jgi:drug/metabolite transporter (DMT)-like permease